MGHKILKSLRPLCYLHPFPHQIVHVVVQCPQPPHKTSLGLPRPQEECGSRGPASPAHGVWPRLSLGRGHGVQSSVRWRWQCCSLLVREKGCSWRENLFTIKQWHFSHRPRDCLCTPQAGWGRGRWGARLPCHPDEVGFPCGLESVVSYRRLHHWSEYPNYITKQPR